MSDVDRKARADERRGTIKVRLTTLDDDCDPWPVWGAEAMSLAAQLSKQVWAFSGRPIPKYSRSEIPMRFSEFDAE